MKKWLLLLLVFACTDALAVTVRGRVDVALQYGVVPMAGANVSLCHVGAGCMNYVTGPDGMYYFNAVPGNQVIMVNGVQRMQLVVPNQPYMDVAPIRGN
ncbi:MAG: hypothetical protein ABI178_02115 [Rhodanobacter sp.]